MKDIEILASVPPKQGKWPDCNQVDSDGKWSHRQPVIRSLSDIQTIVDLRRENAELEKERDVLNSKLKEYDDIYFICKCRPSEMEAHNLEQRAKGVEDAANDSTHSIEATTVYVADLDERVAYLRSQAKALRGE